MQLLPLVMQDLQERGSTKKPSAATNKESQKSGNNNANNGSRKHTIATAHSSPHLPVAAEGRFEKANLADSTDI
jgi:hypothetical protein